MKLNIFGPNLRDQSQGQFVVHVATCADCAKLAREIKATGEYTSLESVARDVYADIIAEGLTVDEAMGEIHFCPCVKLPRSVTMYLDGKPVNNP